MKGRLTSRRQFLTLMGVATASSLMAACGQTAAPTPAAQAPGAATPPPPTAAKESKDVAAAATGTALTAQYSTTVKTKQGADVVQLSYWHAWTGDYEKMVNRVATMFNDTHDKIQVTPQVVPSADFDTKILTSVSAGNPPDTCMLWNSTGRLYSFAAQNALTPLQDVVADLAGFKEWVLPSMWQLGTYKGKMYAVPQWSQAYAIIWNKKMFREAGLDPEKGPKTTTEMFEMAQKLTKKKANGDLQVIGWNGNWVNLWIPGFGGKLVDDSGDKVTANDPANIKALEWMSSFAKAADPTKFADFRNITNPTSGGTVIHPFVSGMCAMYTDGPWLLQTVQRTAPKDLEWGVGSLPSTGNDSKWPYCWTYGDVPALPANGKHKAESAVYVQFLCGFGGEDAYTQMCLSSGLQVPSSKKVVDDGKFAPLIKQYPGYDIYLNDFFSAKSFLYPPNIPTAAFYDQRLRNAVDRTYLGQMSAEQALTECNKEVQADLDKWKSSH